MSSGCGTWSPTRGRASAPGPAPGDRGTTAEDHDPAAAAAQWFADQHGGPPEGVWRAPGRVNLIGEHTDYNDGFVLPFALAAGVTVAAARRAGAVLALASRQPGAQRAAVPLDGLAPGTVTGWAAYPAGVAWALAGAGYPVPGADLVIDADLPAGAGLSSSAALECAVALALSGLAGLDISRPELAALARRAENDFVGAPTGIMDQSAVLLCEPGHALLLDCRSGAATSVPLDLAAARAVILVIDTRARHKLTDGGYADRRRSCEAAARALRVASLRDLTGQDDAAGQVGRLADPVLRRRARHVLAENGRVLAIADLLRDGRVDQAGPLLTASHDSLRDDFEVSWPEADAAVAAAVAAGALGARMTGGGFGGSVIALVPDSQAGAAGAAVTAEFARRGWPPPRIRAEIPAGGAARVR
ncbi:MAG: galactokinase [Streptosporangiaceae bacterium]